jgi:hypothetical protein
MAADDGHEVAARTASAPPLTPAPGTKAASRRSMSGDDPIKQSFARVTGRVWTPCGKVKRGACPQPTADPSGNVVGQPPVVDRRLPERSATAGVTRLGVASPGISARRGRSSTAGAKIFWNPCSRDQDACVRGAIAPGLALALGVTRSDNNPRM